jgi:signal transduction histidine kinase
MTIRSTNAALTRAAIDGLYSDRTLALVERWRRPQGARAVKAWLGFLGLALVVAVVVYATGGTAYVWVHLMYVPIVLAAGTFGLRGGLIGAVIGGFMLGPVMPQDVAKHLPQDATNWLFRAFFFLLVGGFSGVLFSWMNRQLERLRKTHQALVRTHDQLKAAQMNLIQTAKLESVGRLAAGVAHEVKNPLAVLQLGVDYLNNTTKGDEGLAETIKDMDDAVKRADSVIKGLLDFSRSEQLTLTPYDVNAVVEETLSLVKHELTKNHVEVEKYLQDKLPQIKLDRNKLKQVFINLFMNSIQAMGLEGGTLSVRTQLRPWREVAAGHDVTSPDETLPRDEAIVVDVEDTGPGIPDDKIDKLFDPFFTTKAVGNGTGLGLSVSRKIIELHGASIKLGNRKTKGAAAQIVFKLHERN